MINIFASEDTVRNENVHLSFRAIPVNQLSSLSSVTSTVMCMIGLEYLTLPGLHPAPWGRLLPQIALVKTKRLNWLCVCARIKSSTCTANLSDTMLIQLQFSRVDVSLQWISQSG
ncbi:hypothetical protein RRG08_027296 [Elysia crispata]|uniref:Uncharacterized protein n=1 Tax=Elysia crispata TaxID=231223 RepID=A0AAE1AXE2_9GAST|nr:hypothetical protein RRG08_027296 [Elysia crispata]